MRIKKRTKADKRKAERAYANLCKSSLNKKASKTSLRNRRNHIRHNRRLIRARMQEEADRIKKQNDAIADDSVAGMTLANVKLLKIAGIDISSGKDRSEVVVIQDGQVVSNYPLPDNNE